MNAKEYQLRVGIDKTKDVVEMAGTKWSYWQHFTTGHKRPGYDLAKKLVKASQYVTPETPLTIDGLMTPIEQLRGRKAA